MGNPTPVTDGEIEIVAEWIPRFREAGFPDQPVSASTVALGLPAIGARDRLRLVLAEMESRGLVVRVDQQFDHIIGEPRYREVGHRLLSGGGDSQ